MEEINELEDNPLVTGSIIRCGSDHRWMRSLEPRCQTSSVLGIAAFALIYVMPLVAAIDAAVHPAKAWRQAGIWPWPFLVLPLGVVVGVGMIGPARIVALAVVDVVAGIYFAKVRALVDVATGMAGRTVGLAGIQSGAYGPFIPAIVGVPVVVWVTLLLVINASAVALRIALAAGGIAVAAAMIIGCAAWGGRSD